MDGPLGPLLQLMPIVGGGIIPQLQQRTIIMVVGVEEVAVEATVIDTGDEGPEAEEVETAVMVDTTPERTIAGQIKSPASTTQPGRASF